jgi:hypothetical protein
MKKRSSRKPHAPREDMRREYRFDYAKARPNRFAAAFKGQATAVVLDPDVAAVSGDAGSREPSASLRHRGLACGCEAEPTTKLTPGLRGPADAQAERPA